MAVGDVFDVVITSVANNGFLDIRPSAGIEAVIHNVYVGGTWELYKSDGTNSILVDSGVINAGPVSAALHVTNTRYLRVKNVSGASAFFSADGMQTK
jgi:hypothetical protein